MRDVFYQIYRDAAIALAKSIVVKCGAVAEAINQELLLRGHQILDDPSTWKYYRNLAGEYHHTDTPMRIISVDTLTEITFNKENLRIHRATFREYQLGEPLHDQLVRRYPDQIPLIRGILNPVDINTAIEAEDGELLGWESTLVEPNEESLMQDVQAWVKQFFARWYNPQYAITDDLSVPAFLGLLYLNLPNTIQTLRFQRTRTDEVHSFHVREYLASNGALDRYLPYLNNRQRMWLYRNLKYLQANVGQQRIFDAVVKNILLDRRFPLHSYELMQNYSGLPEEIYSTVDGVKRPIGGTYIEPEYQANSIYTILERQNSIARDNPRVLHEADREINRQVSHDHFSRLPTKVLESEMIDRSSASVRSIEHVKINQWLYLASHHRYTTYISVPHPGTGEIMSLDVKEAFIVAVYCFYRMLELDIPDTIPRLIAYDVLRTPLPTYDELVEIIDPDVVPEGMVQAIMDRVTPIGHWLTVDEFHEGCLRLHREYIDLWELHAFQTRMLQEGYAHQLVQRHFMHVKCSLVDRLISFEQWFTDYGYGIEHLTNLELEQLFLDTVAAATGANLTNTQSLSEIHKALLSLTNQLTSYTTQFISTINVDNYWYLAWKRPRVGTVGQASCSYSGVRDRPPTALRLKGTTDKRIAVPETVSKDVNVRGETCASYPTPTQLQWSTRPACYGTARVSLRTVGLRAFSFEVLGESSESGDLGYYTPPE